MHLVYSENISPTLILLFFLCIRNCALKLLLESFPTYEESKNYKYPYKDVFEKYLV